MKPEWLILMSVEQNSQLMIPVFFIFCTSVQLKIQKDGGAFLHWEKRKNEVKK